MNSSVMLPKVRSFAFSQWLRRARHEQGMSQSTAAPAAGLTQQDWSKMERLGRVPQPEVLEKICRVLNRPLSEAMASVQQALITEQHIQEIQSRYGTYKQQRIEREQKGGAVGIFVVREDPVEADYVAAAEYIDLLARTKNTWITLLFRLPDPKSWRSFFQLANAMTQQVGAADPARVLPRIRAFYRHPEYAEQPEASLPLVHPYMLTCDNYGSDLASAVFDETIKQAALLQGFNDPEATQQSLCIVDHDRHRAAQVAQWVGLNSSIEPLSHMWVPVAIAT